MAMAFAAGLLFGFNFDPPTYIATHNCDSASVGCVEKYRGASANPLDYVFSHFCGILLMSMLIFGIYSTCMKNKPWVSAELCFPAMVSGNMWGIAQVAFFVSNGDLGFATAFPLITIGYTTFYKSLAKTLRYDAPAFSHVALFFGLIRFNYHDVCVIRRPGFVSSMWSVFWFKEIQGQRNYLALGGVFATAATSAACLVLSK
jgi:hypothetical protein